MKNKIVFLLLLAALTANSQAIKKQNPKAIIRKASTLDSMQGNWVSIDDKYNRIFVKGRIYQELYVARKDTLVNEYFRIYFSDTLTNDRTLNSPAFKMDTLRTSGNYFISKSLTDSTLWCYLLNGFSFDRKDSYFSISDTWAKRRPTAFRKIK